MSELDHIGDWLDYINEHKVYRYVYLIVVSYIWIKFKATRLYGILSIWIFRKHLSTHQIFDSLDILTVQIPSHIRNLGKKHAFTDFLRVETGLFVIFLTGFIKRLCKINFGSPNLVRPLRYLHEFALYIHDFDYTVDNTPKRLLADYEIFLKDLPEILENGMFSKVEIRQKDIIRYLRNNRETPVVTASDLSEIREYIQRRKLKILISKYEGIMTDYRVQIKKNLAMQITSELNQFEQIKAILKYGFQAVYKSMEITFPRKVNEINGELKGIIYDGFKCAAEAER